jgi:threonylcarbamoyladenosine tRNA methylthiotransferase MtaB
VKYSILTFGCRANQADSSDIERELRVLGGEETRIESADVVVVNTCSVTSTAEQAARQAIRRVGRLNPAAHIVATGCYATRAPLEIRSLTGVKPCFAIREALAGFEPCSAHHDPMPGPGTRGRTLHLLRVQTGCNAQCAYCIVPTTRGRSRSVPIDAVIERVGEAAAAGFKEMMITGVHLGCYGRDLDPARRLADLLRALAADGSGIRFRVSAVEPMDFDDDVIRAVADSRHFARQFHLPLQHASDRILSAMRRPYTVGRYELILEKLLDACPDAAVGTDLIVGFPGETEADFQACVDYLEGSPLAYVHVFPFSPRPGTAAALMDGRPRGQDVRRRVQRMRAIAEDLGGRFRARFVGSVRDGLTIEDGTVVLTDNYLRVRIPPGLPGNERVTVKIVGDGKGLTGLALPISDAARAWTEEQRRLREDEASHRAEAAKSA